MCLCACVLRCTHLQQGCSSVAADQDIETHEQIEEELEAPCLNRFRVLRLSVAQAEVRCCCDLILCDENLGQTIDNLACVYVCVCVRVCVC